MSLESMTINAFSLEVGCSHRTLRSRLIECKIEPIKERGGQSLYRLRDLVTGYLGGDLAAERLRKTKEEADRIALENDKTRGLLVDVDAVIKMGENVFVAVRSIILASCLPTQDQDAILLNLQNLKNMDWSKAV